MENLAFFEWDQREYRRLLQSMLGPPDTRGVLEMRERFQTILAGRPVFPFNMARTGLATALQIFHRERPHADEVIVPSYICPSVVAAIMAAGLHAVPVDIGPDLNIDADAIEELMSPRTLAVLVAHMYGCPARILEIEATCQRRGVFLVDDAAQVVGVSVDGRPLGTFGDIGLISFSQSKAIVTGCHNAGGLLILNNRELEPQVMAAYAALPDSRRRIGDVAAFFWNYVMAPWTQTPSYYFARLFGSSSQSNDPKFEMTTKINSNMAAVALEQLKSLELRISGRRRVADLYHRKVDPQQAIAFPQYAPQRFLTRIVLTLPGGVNIDKVRADLVRRGIRTRGGYPVFTSELRPRPQRALSLRPRLIELPSRSGMSANTVDKIWDAFAACVGSLDPAAG